MNKPSRFDNVKAVGFAIAMVSALLLIALYIAGPAFMETIEDKSFDLRLLVRGPRNPGNAVAIVAVDDKSIKALGRWPWPRSRMAGLLYRLKASGARVAALDIILNEKQGARAADLRDDRDFARAVSAFGNVVLPVVMYVPKGGYRPKTVEAEDYLLDSAFMLTKGRDEDFNYLTAFKADAPPEEIDGGAALGHIYAYLSLDGAIRWEALSIRFGDSYYPSLALVAAREYLGIPAGRMMLELGSCVRLGDITIPTDEHGRMLINYCGPEGTFPTYSFVDVLEGRVGKEAFRDKVVLVGTTAQGIYDLRVTPFSANMPGVEKHANVIENILDGRFIARHEMTKLTDMLAILVVCLVIGLAIPRMGALPGLAVTLSLLLSGWAICYFALVHYGIWLDVVYPTLAVFITYPAGTAYRFLMEERKARDIKKVFSSYVAPKVVDEIIRNPELAKLGGERKELSVLFSDVRGFTTFTESRQPEEVVDRLNEYMGEMTEIIFELDGTVDKFVGDAIMAFWGAPLPQEDHAERAVRCAVTMMMRLREMQDRWRKEGREILDIGIGINTGDMVVGNMGAEGRKMDYTVIGDHVNLGARVEGLTRHYHTGIIITEYTYDRIMGRRPHGGGMPAGISFHRLDSVKVKGKERPVTIYSVDYQEVSER